MLKEKVANKFVSLTISMQKRWAKLMQKITEKIPLRKRKWMVIVFAIAAGGYSLYLIAYSLSGPHRQRLQITHITSPKYITTPGDVSAKKNVLIPEHEYRKIQAFIHYMDSLGTTKLGKLVADSIIAARPGLMDSVQQIQAIYQLQNKK